MNRKSLSPATTAACLVALTEAAERAEEEVRRLEERREETAPRYQERAEMYTAIVVKLEVAEKNMTSARRALAEFRKVAGIDEQDATELTHVG